MHKCNALIYGNENVAGASLLPFPSLHSMSLAMDLLGRWKLLIYGSLNVNLCV